VSEQSAILHLVRSQLDRGTASVDTEFALSVPGVLAVLTPADVAGRSLSGGLPLLAERVQYQGQPVAAVIAETEYTAADAAEALEVTIDADSPTASRHEADSRHVDNGDSLTCVLDQPRWHLAPLQTNGCVAVPDSLGGVAVQAACRDPERFGRALADAVGLAPARVRVDPPAQRGRAFITPDIVMPGHAAAVVAALQLGRPVRWQESRAESLTSGGAHAGFRATAKLDGTPDDSVLRMRLALEVGASALPSLIDESDLRGLPWYDFSSLQIDVEEHHSNLPPAHTDVARVLAQVTVAEGALGLLSRLTGEKLPDLQNRLAAAPLSAALLTAVRAHLGPSAASGVALAPGVAAGVTVSSDPGTGEWAPTSVVVSVCGNASRDVAHALRAGAVDGYGVAAMQQIPFDEQGTCLAATLMDYVMPSSAEAPPVAIRNVPAESARSLEPSLARALATAAVAAAARNAMASLVPGLAGAPAPLRSSDAWEASVA
jgi:CO/xanthine dehydrogenase Mo-binding subunit